MLQDAQGHVWLTDFGLGRRDVDATLSRVGVQSLFAFIIPLAGISWLIQKRRFSLAPLAALACLMTWRTMLTADAAGGETGQEPGHFRSRSAPLNLLAAS